MSVGGRRVRDEEASLWQRVARDVTPLPRGAVALEDAEMAEEEAPPPIKKIKARARKVPKAAPAPPRPLALPDLDPVAPAGLDRRTVRRLKRGQLPAEARLDLHGRTQEQAHDALRDFIQESRMARRRCVLVITGKGSVASGRGGVLRQMVPRWLNEPVAAATHRRHHQRAREQRRRRRALRAAQEPGAHSTQSVAPDEPKSAGAGEGLIAFLDRLARRLALEVHTLWLVFRHRETPWFVKAVLILLLAYLASPVDLIPDVIPVLGMLDDLVVAALALWLAYRLTPPHVMEECRAKASEAAARARGLGLEALAQAHGAGTRRSRALTVRRGGQEDAAHPRASRPTRGGAAPRRRGGQRSSGVNPVRFAMRASMRGPISSLS